MVLQGCVYEPRNGIDIARRNTPFQLHTFFPWQNAHIRLEAKRFDSNGQFIGWETIAENHPQGACQNNPKLNGPDGGGRYYYMFSKMITLGNNNWKRISGETELNWKAEIRTIGIACGSEKKRMFVTFEKSQEAYRCVFDKFNRASGAVVMRDCSRKGNNRNIVTIFAK